MCRFLAASLFGCASSVVIAQTAPTSPPALQQQLTSSVITASVAPSQVLAPLDLAQALEFAHRRNPTLLSASQHLAAVRSQEITAGLRQNPVAIVGGQMLTLGPDDPNGPNFYQGGVQRLFERGNKRGIRLENARSTTSATGFQLEDQRRQIDLQVRQAFAHMLYAQAALAISQDNLSSYRKTVALMQVRLDAGDVDRTDFDRVELQLAGFENDFDNATLALQQSSISLQTLLGIPAPADSCDRESARPKSCRSAGKR